MKLVPDTVKLQLLPDSVLLGIAAVAVQMVLGALLDDRVQLNGGKDLGGIASLDYGRCRNRSSEEGR